MSLFLACSSIFDYSLVRPKVLSFFFLLAKVLTDFINWCLSVFLRFASSTWLILLVEFFSFSIAILSMVPSWGVEFVIWELVNDSELRDSALWDFISSGRLFNEDLVFAPKSIIEGCVVLRMVELAEDLSVSLYGLIFSDWLFCSLSIVMNLSWKIVPLLRPGVTWACSC